MDSARCSSRCTWRPACEKCEPEPTPKPTASEPTPKPTASEACEDSTTWYTKKKTKNGCDWVEKKRVSRCKGKVRDDDGVKAKEACPLACEKCEVQCADSTTWYFKKTKNPCARYVTKKTKNCKKEDDFKVKAQDACPATCDDACELSDSTTWYVKKAKKNCDWVAKDPATKCEKKDDFKVKAEDACPVTCAASEAACADSTTWFYKKAKNTCEAYVAKKTKNCKKKDDSKVKAEDACAVTCETCR